MVIPRMVMYLQLVSHPKLKYQILTFLQIPLLHIVIVL
jgi:hypothetical protein